MSKKGFEGHDKSKCHLEAVDRIVEIPKCTEDISETLSSALAEETSVARQALLKILSNVRFLAREALPR